MLANAVAGAGLRGRSLRAALVTSGCITAHEQRVRDAQAGEIMAIYGTRSFTEDPATIRIASERALRSLGYDILYADARSIGTDARVEQRSTVTTAVASPQSRRSLSVTVAQSDEVLRTRSYEARFEALPDGGTKVSLMPRVRSGEVDITGFLVSTSRQDESHRCDAIFQEVTRLARMVDTGSLADTPSVVAGEG